MSEKQSKIRKTIGKTEVEEDDAAFLNKTRSAHSQHKLREHPTQQSETKQLQRLEQRDKWLHQQPNHAYYPQPHRPILQFNQEFIKDTDALDHQVIGNSRSVFKSKHLFEGRLEQGGWRVEQRYKPGWNRVDGQDARYRNEQGESRKKQGSHEEYQWWLCGRKSKRERIWIE